MMVQRLGQLVISLFVAATVVFFLLEVLPGDPAAIMLGVGAEESTLAAVRIELGLDRPVLDRYFSWIFGLLTLDLGQSYFYGGSVADLVAERLSVSAPLAILAIALSTGIAIPLGVFAAALRGTIIDSSILLFAQLGLAIPNFWFAILLSLLFSVTLQWTPAVGFPGWEAGLGSGLHALILPVIALALPQAAILTRVTRSSVLEAIGADYVRTAYAKGFSRNAVLFREVLRNALIPVLTILGLQMTFLIAGTVIIENVFALPGLGRLVFQAVSQRDLAVVQGVVLVIAATAIIVSFVVDILYTLADPRLRTQRLGAVS